MDGIAFSKAMERLLVVVQKLSLARDLETIISIVRKEAREITGADGATFVLREGNCCYYAEENAISPLWKGKRFPMEACISGWVMLNREAVAIEDIYQDARIPVEAYRPTFVKSLAMVPIRKDSPIGAIGNYWSHTRTPTKEEMTILQALADSTSIAMENVQLFGDLAKNLEEKTLREQEYRQLADQLKESLDEKEVLLREVYHRVKNNLQVISSLLRLQAKEIREPSVEKALMSSISRVQSMTLVHEMLYQRKNLAKISMKEYIRQLLSHLYEIYGVNSDRIKLIEEIEDVSLKIDAAIPCGLIMSEILSNTFKYAFPNNQLGEIRFSLKNQDGKTSVAISDNGVGFPKTIQFENTTTLGLRLIRNLTKQIDGEVSVQCDQQGTHYTLVFPSV